MEVEHMDVDYESYEFTEVDSIELSKAHAIPNLPCLMPPTPREQQDEKYSQISLFKQEQPKIKIEWQAPDHDEPHQKQHSLQSRRQQTNEPVCPHEDFASAASSSAASAAANNGACPPGIEGFDNLPDCCPEPEPTNLPALSADEVGSVLQQLELADGGSKSDDCHDAAPPSVPEIRESGPPPDTAVLLISTPQQQQQQQHRIRSQATISLVSAPQHHQQHEAPATPECLLGDGPDAAALMHELMDDVSDDVSIGSCDHIPLPQSCGAHCNSQDQSEHRTYDDVARHLVELHRALAGHLPHTKRKPMMHEFLGYVLFRRDTQLAPLHDSVYFCRENGDRLLPQRPSSHFRVANFDAVSEVWKRIKCNSSRDCAKNMKRAMRMSTSNDRRYFENLTHRLHRQQIFRFGQRSLEFFQQVFPAGVH